MAAAAAAAAAPQRPAPAVSARTRLEAANNNGVRVTQPSDALAPAAENTKKILEPFLDLCVSSLRRGHANLLCIVPILTDVRRHNFATSALPYTRP